MYSLAFDDTEMVIAIDKDGIGDQGYKQSDALRLTCKQIRRETQRYNSPPIDKLVIKPRCERTKYGGIAIDALFDFDKWSNAGLVARFSRPLQVELHVGEIDIIKLDSNHAWRVEMARIVSNLPCEALGTWMFDFTVFLTIAAPPAKTWEVRIPIPKDGSDKTHGLRASVVSAMRPLMRDTGGLMAAEWISLSINEVAAERRKVWEALYTAQEQIRQGLFKAR